MNFSRRFLCFFCSLYEDLRKHYLFFYSKAKVVKSDGLPLKNAFEHLPTNFVFSIFPAIRTFEGEDRGAKGAL